MSTLSSYIIVYQFNLKFVLFNEPVSFNVVSHYIGVNLPVTGKAVFYTILPAKK